jgi:RNA polymerase sigma-70 factor (family 1)
MKMAVENLHHAEDSELLIKLTNGDRAAFDALYNRHWKMVFDAAYKRVDNVDDAKDIAQEVFVQLWQRRTKAPIKQLSSYLFVAARNGVFKHFEQQNKFVTGSDAAYHQQDPTFADQPLLYKEFIQNFAQLVAALPPQQQQIFSMRFEKDMSSQEIATALGISPKTVRNLLGRSLTTLKSSIFTLFVIATCFSAVK